jgi:hypothetical protein
MLQQSVCIRLVRRFVTWGAFALLPAAFAANGPPTKEIQGAVEVVNDVQVHGVVEVINDVLRTPYSASAFNMASPGSIGTLAAQVRFDIPVGKRLIVESVTVRVRLSTGQMPEVEMTHNTVGTPNADIVLTPQGSTGTVDTYKASLPLKLRVDGRATDADLFFTLSRSAPTSAVADLRVALFGYLIDIP